jgi:hypothetical protein
MKTIITEILDDAVKYLHGQSYTASGQRLSFPQWFKNLENAIEILREARSRVRNSPKIAIERASTVFNIVDEKGDLNNILGTYVVIDEARLEYELLIDSIRDEEVQGMLPFFTRLEYGNNYVHITNASPYLAVTNSHDIAKDETLCKRGERSIPTIKTIPTCPGCLVKAKAIIVNHLFSL